jgi:hypothetical protein
MNVTEYGYLEGPYLDEPYLAQQVDASLPSQANRRITVEQSTKFQVLLKIEAISSVKTQINRLLVANNYPALTQAQLRIEDSETIRTQISRRIDSGSNHLLSQIQRKIDSGLQNIKTQIEKRIDSGNDSAKTQIQRLLIKEVTSKTQIDRRITSGLSVARTEITRTSIVHSNCYGYLEDPYLDAPYLGNRVCAAMRTQVERIRAISLHTQIVRALYNTKLIRILHRFPSRGTSGVNWTQIIGTTAAGDFGLNNVNTDIVEQVWRAVGTTATIQCDTEVAQGIFLDTLAILNHNFTTSATVQLQGSNSSIFATTPYSQNLTTELTDMFWIEPYLPLSSYRYWRFVINDPTNTADIQIGTIVFGSSIIFNGECIVDQVQKRKIHFSDKVKTEGFTNVSNDRALKKAVSFSFKSLDYTLENYQNLNDVIDYIRTSLKALWIIDPRFASRFAVFGKMPDIPAENHRVLGATLDYIDIDVTVDESL